MPLSDALLPEFDQEMANTRKTLERLPADKFGFTPHAKSWPLGTLANHLATLPQWASVTIESDSMDVAPEGAPHEQPAAAATTGELLAAFDRNAAAARAAIAGADDARLRGPWSLVAGGKTLFTMPRIAVLRAFVMNHLIHHRGQLTVYMRLTGLPVPALYGPSADEGAM